MSKIKKNFFDFVEQGRVAWNETKPFLLSHHKKEDYKKCFFILNTSLCSRCIGIYAGIIVGLFFGQTSFFVSNYLWALIFFPLPMLMDWYLVEHKIINGSNSIRFVTGFLVGVIYLLGLFQLWNRFPDYPTIFFGGLYGVIALMLLYQKHAPKK
jgi:uncharacterized membrane protein